MAVTDTTDKPRSRSDRGSAVQRTFALLEMIVSENRPMSLAQMAERLALPKPTVHRLASRLETEGLLAREPSGKRASTIGEDSSIRRPTRETMRSIIVIKCF